MCGLGTLPPGSKWGSCIQGKRRPPWTHPDPLFYEFQTSKWVNRKLDGTGTRGAAELQPQGLGPARVMVGTWAAAANRGIWQHERSRCTSWFFCPTGWLLRKGNTFFKPPLDGEKSLNFQTMVSCQFHVIGIILFLL